MAFVINIRVEVPAGSREEAMYHVKPLLEHVRKFKDVEVPPGEPIIRQRGKTINYVWEDVDK